MTFVRADRRVPGSDAAHGLLLAAPAPNAGRGAKHNQVLGYSRVVAGAAAIPAPVGGGGAVDDEQPAEAGASDPIQWLSRMTYSGSYALSYGLVYAAVFIAQSLPQENPIMRGFRDGGREAVEQLIDG